MTREQLLVASIGILVVVIVALICIGARAHFNSLVGSEEDEE